MNFKLFIVLQFISAIGFAQGLNAELGFNDNYDQNSKAVVCVDDYTYFIKFQKYSNSFFSICTLYKIDTTGSVIWTSQVTPIAAEYTDVYEMIPSVDGGVYILGYGLPTCDVGQDCFWYIQKFDSTGLIDWIHTWINSSCIIPTYLSGLSLNTNNQLLVNFIDTTTSSYIFNFDNFGVITDSLQISNSQLSGICEITGYEYIGYKGDSLYAFDANGSIVNDIEFNTNIQNITSLNDSLYILTMDSIYIFDNNLNVLLGSDVAGYSYFSNIKVSNNKIQFISNGFGNQTILELDKQLQLSNSISIPVDSNYSASKDFSSSHFSVAINFPITLHHAIRYLDYSLSSPQNSSVNATDIGVVDVDLTQISIQPQGSPGVYTYQIWASALVKNYGNNTLNTCRINHRIVPWGICNETFYTNEFMNLNLSPNDSMWINLGLVHIETNHFTDTIDLDLCVFTSHPNQVTDTIVSNDQFCTYVLLGMVGLHENLTQNISIYPNPVKDLVHIDNPEFLDLSIYVYNILGKVITMDSGSGNLFSFDLSNQSEGLYLIRIISKDAEVTKIISKL